MTVYRVHGPYAYREHKPGTVFEATLDPLEELRALRRGNVTILDSSPTRLRPGSVTLPDGWQPQANTRAPEGALPLKEA